jgi:hypothetical protein
MDPFYKSFLETFKRMPILFPHELNLEKRTVKEFPESFGNYVGENIKKHIISNVWLETRYTYRFDGTKIELTTWNIPGKRNSDKKNKHILNFFIASLNKIVGSQKAVVRVMLIACPLEKMLPKTMGATIASDNVNSAFASLPSSRDPHGFVVVYRKEELHKVVLHELVHLYGLDFRSYDPKYDILFQTMYNITVKHPHKNSRNALALYETYTETLAAYGSIITSVLFDKKSSNKSAAVVRQSVEARITREARFFRSRVANIFSHFSHATFVEDTHVFAYYILKSAIFEHLPLFIQLITKHGVCVRDPVPFLELCRFCCERSLKNNFSHKTYDHSLRMTSISI